MNCPGCDKPLTKHELAQPMAVMGWRIRPPSFCDTCCRAGQWAPGSSAALERLTSGTIDPAEADRVSAATSTWTPPYTQVLHDIRDVNKHG